MKNKGHEMEIKKFSALISAVFAITAFAAFDEGGVSMDFSKIARETAPAKGSNLLTFSDSFNQRDDRWGWKSDYNFQGVSEDERRELKQKGKPYFHASAGKTLTVTTDDAAAKFLNAKGDPQMTNALWRQFKFATPGSYMIEFKVKGRLAKGPGVCTGRYTVSMLDEKNRRIIPDFTGKITPTENFTVQQIKINIPEKVKSIQIAFSMYGMGQMEIQDLAMYPVTEKHEIAIRLYPQTHFGNVYHAPSRRPAFIYFVQNNGQLKPDHPELHLRLPAGVKCLGAARNLGHTPKQEGDNLIFSMKNSWFRGQDYWTGPVVVYADAEPSDRKMKIEYWTRNGGKDGTHHSFDLVVVEPVSAAPQPKKFYAGMKSTSLENFADDLMKTAASYYKECGFNIICGGYFTPNTGDILKDAGFATAWWPTSPGPNDGYDMGAKDKPESVRYKLIDGSYMKARRNGWMICPEEAASNGEHFRTEVTDKLQKILVEKKYNFLMSNWEPQDGLRGCWCDRCREAFILDSKLPANEVRAAWPHQILQKWKERWQVFRARQHGKVLKNTNEAVKAAGTGAFFLPAVTSDCLWETTWQRYREYGGPEFIDKLDWINVWGPYVYYDIDEPFVQQTGCMLKTFFNARMVKDFIAKRISDPKKQPKLASYPQQSQCMTWLTFPEASAMEAMSQYLCGWNAYLLYFFPMGSDYRLFRAMTEVNRVIAETEDIIHGGTPLPDPEVKTVTPLPKSYFHGGQDVRMPALDKAEMIQSVAWKNGDKYLLAVGNFWENAECFFTLSFPGLKKDTAYTLRTAGSGETFAFTGKELADGVLLQCGAMRWRVYTLTEGKPSGKCYTRSDMEALMKSRLPGIRECANKENLRRQQEAAGDTVPDYKGNSGSSNAGITLNANDAGVLSVTGPQYVMKLDLAHGAGITSWKIKGEEFSGKYPLACDGFLGTGGFVSGGPYILKDIRKVSGGLELCLERKISLKDSKTLNGLLIRKSIIFLADRASISTTIVNPSGSSQSFVFRFHSMPAFDEVFWNGKKMPRHYETESKAVGSVEWKGKHLSVIAEAGPKALLREFVFWDGTTCPTRTFEPVYHEVSLTAGTSHKFTLEFRIK